MGDRRRRDEEPNHADPRDRIEAWGFARTGGAVLTEADRLDPDDPPAALRTGLAATLHLEQAVTRIEWGEGLALRYGGFYGPGTGISLAPDAVMAEPIASVGSRSSATVAGSGRTSIGRNLA